MVDTNINISNDNGSKDYNANSKKLETTGFMWVNWDSDNDYAVPFTPPGMTEPIFMRQDQIDAILFTADRMGGGNSMPDDAATVTITSKGNTVTMSTQEFANALRAQARGVLSNG